MLKNERQYNSARVQLQKWVKNRKVLAKRVAAKATPDWVLDQERFAIEEQIRQLESEIQEYDDTASGKRQLQSPAKVLEQLPTLLVSCRIAKHWTQKELAIRVGINENLIQKYESENYSCASLQTMYKIAEVLQEGLPNGTPPRTVPKAT